MNNGTMQYISHITPGNCQSITRHRIYTALRRAGLLPAAAYSLAYLQLNTARAPSWK